MLDRQKEALFNMLQPRLPCAGVLDLFAGSGSLGLEALSRGAERATFVERWGAALAALRRNLAALGVEGRTRVLGVDALGFDPALVEHPVGVVFCDPPFALAMERPGLLVQRLEALPAGLELQPGALLVLRLPHEASLPETPRGLSLERTRELGRSRLLLLEAPA